MLYWRAEPYARSHRKRKAHESVQQVLFDLAQVEPAVGAEGVAVPHSWLRVVPKNPPHQTEE